MKEWNYYSVHLLEPFPTAGKGYRPTVWPYIVNRNSSKYFTNHHIGGGGSYTCLPLALKLWIYICLRATKENLLQCHVHSNETDYIYASYRVTQLLRCNCKTHTTIHIYIRVATCFPIVGILTALIFIIILFKYNFRHTKYLTDTCKFVDI